MVCKTLKGDGGREMSENKVIWHPYPQEKPKKEKPYLVTTKKCNSSKTIVGIDTFFIDWKDFVLEYPKPTFYMVVAWAELPDPYKEETNE